MCKYRTFVGLKLGKSQTIVGLFGEKNTQIVDFGSRDYMGFSWVWEE